MNKEIKEIKWCNKCGKEHTVTVVDTDGVKRAKKSFILRAFSPGKIRINRKYKCTRCFHEFSEASFNEAVIVPMLITLVLTVTLLVFLYIVFYVI